VVVNLESVLENGTEIIKVTLLQRCPFDYLHTIVSVVICRGGFIFDFVVWSSSPVSARMSVIEVGLLERCLGDTLRTVVSVVIQRGRIGFDFVVMRSFSLVSARTSDWSVTSFLRWDKIYISAVLCGFREVWLGNNVHVRVDVCVTVVTVE